MAWEWLAPVATLAAGAVGITGTVLAARLGSKGQVEVARTQAITGVSVALVQEKRMTYVKFMHSAKQLEGLGRELRKYLETTPTADEEDAEVVRFTSRVSDLLDELERQQVEIAILGGPDLGSLALRYATAVGRYAKVLRERDTLFQPHLDLADAMNSDLDPTREKTAARRARRAHEDDRRSRPAGMA